jgi:hypothetical protein
VAAEGERCRARLIFLLLHGDANPSMPTPPGPLPSLFSPVSWRLAGATPPPPSSSTAGRTEPPRPPATFTAVNASPPTSSTRCPSPRNRRTAQASGPLLAVAGVGHRRRTRTGQHIAGEANELELVQAEASGATHRPHKFFAAHDHRPELTPATKLTPASSARLGHPRLPYKRDPRAPLASPIASTITQSPSEPLTRPRGGHLLPLRSPLRRLCPRTVRRRYTTTAAQTLPVIS